MVDKRPTAQTRKRLAKALQDDFWDCSVCTFRNSPEAFKCSVCDVRKGTSTRKPRLNQQIVAQQEATRLVTIQQAPVPPAAPAQPAPKKLKSDGEGSPEPSDRSKQKRRKKAKCHIKGIDRSSADNYSITVNDSTVVFTEFRPKK